MNAIQQTERPAVGDVIVVGGHSVGSERTMGEILEIRGEPEHERYRIRWEDGHESIFHPADGEATIHHYAPHGASVELMRSLVKIIGVQGFSHPLADLLQAADDPALLPGGGQ